jgi:hypothetical protein
MKLLRKFTCWLGFHVRGYPHGLTNIFERHLRVDYYTCKHCKKKQMKVVETDY